MKTKITLLLFLALILIQCQNMNDKYDWLIQTTADRGYHMKILRGNLYDQEGKAFSIPSRQFLQAGWFGDSGTMIVGEQYRHVPAKMDIEWYSYAEDKFYAGTFQLDHGKILSLFQQKLKCAYVKNASYSSFKVSLAPGGQVCLYLQGGNTILVGQFTAQEKQVSDFNSAFGYDGSETREDIFKDFVEDMPLQTQKEIAEKNINTQIWKDINQRYPWKFTWEVEDQSPKLTMAEDKKGIDFLSGESMWCISGSNYLIETEPKPIPIRINGIFETPAGRNFTINVSPGNIDGKELRYQEYMPYRQREQALVKQFKEFYKKTGEQAFEIHLRINEDYNEGKVFLKKGNIEEEIPNVEVQISNNTFGKKK